MSDLERAVELATQERKTRKGRQQYSLELKDAIRAASEVHTKAEIGKRTGLSYPTLQKIIGSTSRSKRRKARQHAKPSVGSVTVAIQVTLPSGRVLQYQDVETLRADAAVLKAAAAQVG